MTSRTPASLPLTGYSLVLPPGWVQIPLDDGAAPAVRKLLDRAFADLPRDVPPDMAASLRRRLEGHLTARVAEARRTGGTELYVPTERMGGVLVPASFVVADVRPGTEDDPVDEVDLVGRVLARLVAADDSARVIEVDGALAVRTDSRSASDPDRSLGVRAASRRVDYVLAVPGVPGRWLAVSCTVLEAEDDDHDLAGLLVELFDAVMTTFRWGVR
jgi:hypothetical protein